MTPSRYDSVNNINYAANTLFSTGLAASMAVNTLMMGMIVFRIFKDTGALPITSIEQTLRSTEGNKFRHIIFLIIESGMALLAIQVVWLVLGFVPVTAAQRTGLVTVNDFVITMNQVLTLCYM